MSKPLIKSIIKEVTGKDADYIALNRSDIIKIAEKYNAEILNEKARLEKDNQKKNHRKIISHRVKIAYSKGVKHGYMLHADEQYEKAMFEMWKKHVAGPTEANACFNEHARFADVENFEIVEPEVIVK